MGIRKEGKEKKRNWPACNFHVFFRRKYNWEKALRARGKWEFQRDDYGDFDAREGEVRTAHLPYVSRKESYRMGVAVWVPPPNT